MDSFTREDKKLLDSSDQSDHYLMMDLGDSDLDDFDLDSLSPVLQTSFSRSSQAVQNSHVQNSTSQPRKASPIVMNATQTVITSSIQLNSPTLSHVTNASQSEKAPAIRHKKSSTFEGRKRTIQLRAQAKNLSSGNLGQLPITLSDNNATLTVQKRSMNDSVSKEKTTKKLKCGNMKPVPPLCADAQSDGDCDTISLYAKDEDYMSLYMNNPLREVSLDKSVGISNLGKDKQRNVVFTGNASSTESDAGKGWDLRHRIPKTANADMQTMLMSNITELLNKNTRSETLVAASKFCEAYVDNQIQKVNMDFYCLIRRLAERLWNYNEMRYLYRIVQHAIDMQIELSDQVLCGLIKHLGRSFDVEKISSILNRMKDKSLVFGDIVVATANQFLSRRNPPNISNTAQNSNYEDMEWKKPTGNNLTLSRTVEKDVNGPLRSENWESFCKSATDSLLQISPQKRCGILKTVSCNNVIDWKKEPLFIEIQNEKTRRSCFGCVPHDKRKLDGVYKASDNEHGCDGNERIAQDEAVDLKMLGKCVGQLAETIRNLGIVNTLFDAFADLLSSLLEKQNKRVGVVEKQSGKAERVDSVCTDFKVFLESALESAKDHENKDRVTVWLSWIGAKTNSKLSMATAYKISRLMKCMKLNLIPPVQDEASQTEKKARFQSAETIVRTCLHRSDVDLAMQVVKEYVVGKRYDPGPVLSPLVCKMLCSVAELAHRKKRFFDAGICMGMLPAGFGDGLECGLMEEILLGIFTLSGLRSKEEETICNEMVEQMLARSMATEIRTIIVKAFCASVVPVFKYLEGKGVYRRPQIAQCPHLIILPYMLSTEEMALVVQRHLTELCEYLMEMNEKLRMDIPMRIVLCKNTGSLRPLSPIKSTNFRVAYDAGLNRVTKMLTSILDPSLKISSKGLQPKKQEYVINVAISSVRMWMVANTEYGEETKPDREELNVYL